MGVFTFHILCSEHYWGKGRKFESLGRGDKGDKGVG